MSRADPFGLVGKVLDARYRVEEVVGEGGFGVVYRAMQISFDEPVAIKVLKLPGHLPTDQRTTFVATFVAEGRHLRRLSAEHPAFVKALDTGIADIGGVPAPYLVLEWLEGEPLEQELRRRMKAGERGQPLADILACLGPVVQALNHAHTRQVAHRDVKPANIFLVRNRADATVKLLDFGMAKVMTQSGTEAFHTPTQGGILGLTPNYAAPEQWHKKLSATGPWTDVYALALVLVEMLTDRPALAGDDMPQLMAATFDDVRPTPLARGAQVSAEVEAIFAKALAKMPKDRHRTAGEFWNALEEVVHKESGSSEAPPRPMSTVVMEPLIADDVPANATELPAKVAVAVAQMDSAKTDAGKTERFVVGSDSLPAAAVTGVRDQTMTQPAAPEATPRDKARGGTAGMGMWAAAAVIVVVGVVILARRADPLPGPLPMATTSTLPVSAPAPPARQKEPWWNNDLVKRTPPQEKWLAVRKRATDLATTKDFVGAERELREARKIACSELEQSDPACVETLRILAGAMAQQGKLEEAENLLREALEIMKKQGDPDEQALLDLRDAMVQVLKAQGKDAEAERILGGEDPLAVLRAVGSTMAASVAITAQPTATGASTLRGPRKPPPGPSSSAATKPTSPPEPGLLDPE